jgi:hypothetical protein
MRQQRVEFVETRREFSWVPVPDHFEFRPTGSFQRLQRWAWKFLHRRGALHEASRKEVKYTRHVVDCTDIVERLIRARSGLLEGDPRELLIGSEDFADLMTLPPLRIRHDFDLEYRSTGRIMNLKVRVIPWMSGMLVMP